MAAQTTTLEKPAAPRQTQAQPLTLRGGGSKRISMWIDPDVLTQLKKDAEATGVAYSEVIRQLVEQFLAQPTAKRRAALRNTHKGQSVFDADAKVHFQIGLAA